MSSIAIDRSRSGSSFPSNLAISALSAGSDSPLRTLSANVSSAILEALIVPFRLASKSPIDHSSSVRARPLNLILPLTENPYRAEAIAHGPMTFPTPPTT